MTPHQTLDAVKGGLDLSFMEITKALFETGDIPKRDKHWLTREVMHHLEQAPQGMTCNELAKLCHTNPDCVRVSLSRNSNAYISQWVLGKSQRYTAIYKAVKHGLERPKDAPQPNIAMDRDERLKQMGHKPQGLTRWVM